jgi:hypothetical protein
MITVLLIVAAFVAIGWFVGRFRRRSVASHSGSAQGSEHSHRGC